MPFTPPPEAVEAPVETTNELQQIAQEHDVVTATPDTEYVEAIQQDLGLTKHEELSVSMDNSAGSLNGKKQKIFVPRAIYPVPFLNEDNSFDPESLIPSDLLERSAAPKKTWHESLDHLAEQIDEDNPQDANSPIEAVSDVSNPLTEMPTNTQLASSEIQPPRSFSVQGVSISEEGTASMTDVQISGQAQPVIHSLLSDGLRKRAEDLHQRYTAELSSKTCLFFRERKRDKQTALNELLQGSTVAEVQANHPGASKGFFSHRLRDVMRQAQMEAATATLQANVDSEQTIEMERLA